MRGSVFKRCPCGTTGINGRPACKKPHGTWTWRAEADQDPQTGKRRQPSKGGYRTRAEAEDALDDAASAARDGGWADDKQMTVGQWLTKWLDECDTAVAEGDLELKTVRGYKSHVDLILIPRIGHIRLRDLRRHHVDTMLRSVRSPDEAPAPNPPRPLDEKVTCKGTRKDGQPCTRWANRGDDFCPRHGGKTPQVRRNGGRVVEIRSAGTLDGYRRTLRSALAVAKRRDIISSNPAEGKIDAIPRRARSSTTWWEPDQASTFLTGIPRDDPARLAMYETAAFSGIRRGELLGLRWSDLELTGPHPGLTIRQTLSDISGLHDCPVCGGEHRGRRLKGQPVRERERGAKSDAGVRWVPLVPATVRALERHRAAQDALKADWAEAYRDHGLVFARPDGDPFHPRAVTGAFQALSESLGLPVIELHEVRHGACALLLAAGVPIEIVSMILGHANVAITRKIYAHILRAPASDGMKAAVALVRGEAA